MSHDTHEHQKENKTIISFKSAFWLVVIIVGLFVAALNFIQAESGPGAEKQGESKEKTEMTTTATSPAEGQQKNTEAASPSTAPQSQDTAGKNGK